MDANLKARLPGIVRQILADNSGGIKLTALVAEVLQNLYQANETIHEPGLFADQFELLLEEMKPYNIFVLDYSWDMSGKGTGPVRAKSFVYTKF